MISTLSESKFLLAIPPEQLSPGRSGNAQTSDNVPTLRLPTSPSRLISEGVHHIFGKIMIVARIDKMKRLYRIRLKQAVQLFPTISIAIAVDAVKVTTVDMNDVAA